MIVTTYQYIDLYQKVFSEKCTRYFLFLMVGEWVLSFRHGLCGALCEVMR